MAVWIGPLQEGPRLSIPEKGVVLDASACLAFLYKEEGHKSVDDLLNKTACFVSSANWSEVVQKTRQKSEGKPSLKLIGLIESFLKTYRIKVEPVTIEDAEWAAEQWKPGISLSLADRFCLALSYRMRIPAVTADRKWSNSEWVSSDLRIIQIR